MTDIIELELLTDEKPIEIEIENEEAPITSEIADEAVFGGYDKGYTEGETAGYQKGHTEGYTEGENVGFEAGQKDGYANGYTEGETAGYDKGKADGIETEYDRFWDLFQNYGNRKDYDRTFCSSGWDIITFKPKYDIVPTNAVELFYNFNRNNHNNTGTIDMVEHLKSIEIELDVSNAADIQYFACFSRIKRFGKLDLKKVTNMSQGFVYCSYLVTIDELILYETNGTYTNTFQGCTALTNITFGGVIANNLNLSYCSKLSHASLISAIEHLEDYSADTSGTTHKLTLGSTNVAKLTTEELQEIYDKGWVYS